MISQCRVIWRSCCHNLVISKQCQYWNGNKSWNYNFIYSSSLTKEIKPISVNLEEYVFEFDNGHIKYFTEYYKVIDVIGQGSYGVVLSAYDLSKKASIVAIKVLEILKIRLYPNINLKTLTNFSREKLRFKQKWTIKMSLNWIMLERTLIIYSL